jgi:hypothetical protein
VTEIAKGLCESSIEYWLGHAFEIITRAQGEDYLKMGLSLKHELGQKQCLYPSASMEILPITTYRLD